MTERASRSRIEAVDRWRGAALAGMVVFHGAWDLHWFGLIDVDPGRSAGWRFLGHGVATVFLFLSGFSLVLARRRGAGTIPALRRIAVVALAAFAVTLATRIAAPEQTIVFGILHCIALSNLIALPLLRVPRLVVFALALGVALAPTLVGDSLPAALWWVGLSAFVPDTLDYRTLLPWLSPVLLGVVAARSTGTGFASEGRSDGRFARGTAWAGRHSLGLYLVHQPVLLVGILGLTALVGSRSPAGSPVSDSGASSDFLDRCRSDCEREGATPELCRSACACVKAAIAPSPSGPLTPPSGGLDQPALAKIVGSCLASRPVPAERTAIPP